MATFTKINDWIENLSNNATIDLNADTLQIKLTNTPYASETPDPTTDGNGVAVNGTDIVYTNYTDDMAVDRVLEGVSSTQTAGVYTLDANDIIITAAIGTLPDFRYLLLFDQSGTIVVDPLIGAWDHGAIISLALGESATVTWHASGIYTIT